jgi:hypothetical protein
MISESSSGHICFGKGDLSSCAMGDYGRPTVIISPIDIKWVYKINDSGLCINRKDLHMIIEDKNMPKDVKKIIQRIFPRLEGEELWRPNNANL